jgi:hypothetical protein
VFRPSKLHLGCEWTVGALVFFVLSASHRRHGLGVCFPGGTFSVARGTTDRPLGSPCGLFLHPLAMRLILGIDPDSHLQGGWQSASERLKMLDGSGARSRFRVKATSRCAIGGDRAYDGQRYRLQGHAHPGSCRAPPPAAATPPRATHSASPPRRPSAHIRHVLRGSTHMASRRPARPTRQQRQSPDTHPLLRAPDARPLLASRRPLAPWW